MSSPSPPGEGPGVKFYPQYPSLRESRKIIGLLIAVGLSLSPVTNAQHTHKAKTTTIHRAKTVHVRSYTTKKGKHVASYHRALPRRK
jgi:hypothetical protein